MSAVPLAVRGVAVTGVAVRGVGGQGLEGWGQGIRPTTLWYVCTVADDDRNLRSDHPVSDMHYCTLYCTNVANLGHSGLETVISHDNF